MYEHFQVKFEFFPPVLPILPTLCECSISITCWSVEECDTIDRKVYFITYTCMCVLMHKINKTGTHTQKNLYASELCNSTAKSCRLSESVLKVFDRALKHFADFTVGQHWAPMDLVGVRAKVCECLRGYIGTGSKTSGHNEKHLAVP